MTDFRRRRIGRFSSIYEVYSDPRITNFNMAVADLIVWVDEPNDSRWFFKKTTGDNVDIREIFITPEILTGTAQTVGAVEETAITIAVATDTSINVVFNVNAKEVGTDNEMHASYLAGFRNNSGVLTQIDSAPDAIARVSDIGLIRGSADVSGTDALITCIGRAGQTWDFEVDAVVKEVAI